MMNKSDSYFSQGETIHKFLIKFSSRTDGHMSLNVSHCILCILKDTVDRRLPEIIILCGLDVFEKKPHP